MDVRSLPAGYASVPNAEGASDWFEELMDLYLKGYLWPDVHQALAGEIRRRRQGA